ncbi:MAG TPA: hypothetical protein VGH92_11785, partial [Gaiellaceae bacterium]
MTRARPEVLTQAVLDRSGKPGLELGGRRGQRLDLLACPFERRVERGRLRSPLARTGDPLE